MGSQNLVPATRLNYGNLTSEWSHGSTSDCTLGPSWTPSPHSILLYKSSKWQFSHAVNQMLHHVLLEVVQGQIYIYIHLYIYSRFVLERLTLQKTRLKLVILSNIFPHRYLQKESLFLSLKCKMFTFVFLQWFQPR